VGAALHCGESELVAGAGSEWGSVAFSYTNMILMA